MDSHGPRYAVVTLVTSDSYLAGALVALSSLLDAEGGSPTAREFATVCLATPQTVGHATLQALDKAFDQVIGVEPILTQSWEELRLLGQSGPPYPKPKPARGRSPNHRSIALSRSAWAGRRNCLYTSLERAADCLARSHFALASQPSTSPRVASPTTDLL